MSGLLLHITTLADWSAGARAGTYGEDRLAVDGFLHLSTPEQVARPANALFAGHRDAWLLVIDEERLPIPVRWEAGDPPAEDGARFPHLHAPLPAAAVIAAVPYQPGADGTFGPPVGLPEPEDHLQRAYALECYLARARAARMGELDATYASRHHDDADASQHKRLVLRRDQSPAEAAALCRLELPGVDHWRVQVEGPASAAVVSAYEAAGWVHTESVIMVASAVSTRVADPTVQVVEDIAATTTDQDEAWDEDVPRLMDPELHEIVELEALTAAVAQSHHLAVLDDDGEPTAWADLYAAGATAQLENVMARLDQRGCGLATAVALEAVDRAHRMGCDVVFLRTDADDLPRHHYAQLGFRAMDVAHVFDLEAHASTG